MLRFILLACLLLTAGCTPFSGQDLENAVSESDLTVLVRMQAYPAWEKQAGTALKEYLDFVEQVGMRFTDIELYRRHIPSVSAELREWLGHRDTARVQKGLDVIHLLSDHELRIQTVSYGSLDPSYSLTLLYSQVSNLSQNSHREQIRQQAVQVLSGLEKLKHAY